MTGTLIEFYNTHIMGGLWFNLQSINKMHTEGQTEGQEYFLSRHSIFPIVLLLFDEDFIDINMGIIKENYFVELPISVFYVQVQSINFNKKENKINLKYKIFDKKYRDSKTIIDNLTLYVFDIFSIGSILVKRINILNEYVDSGRDISNLNKVIVLSDSNDKLGIGITKRIIFKTVNNLEFSFYENSDYVATKDNSFWKELEISNLPKSKHILVILEKALIKFFKINQWEKKTNILEDKIIISYDRYRDYSPHFARKPFSPNNKFLNTLIDFIKVEMIRHFHESEYNFDLMEINNKEK